MSATHAARDKEVRDQLDSLRDDPVDNERCSDSILVLIYDYLMGVTEKNVDSSPHWFCEKASPLTVDAATFLLRLRAYNSPQVIHWVKKLQECLLGCVGCVKGLEEAKTSSKSTYFGAFPGDVVDNFFLDLDRWQASVIITAHKSLESSTLGGHSGIPDAFVYQMVASLNILQEPNIYGILSSHPPTQKFYAWPMNPPPVGILVLLVCPNAELRDWAAQCLAPRMKVPISLEQFNSQYRAALHMVVSALDSTSAAPSSLLSPDRTELWKGFRTFIQQIPTEILLSTSQSANPRRLVAGNLHDTGPQFISILQSFGFLLKRLGRDMWRGEGPDYPQEVFDRVKDNEAFLKLLSSVDRPTWLLSYFSELLHTLRETPSYADVLGRTADFLFDELQEERFLDSRPAILSSAIQLLNSAFQSTLPLDDQSQQSKSDARRLDFSHQHDSVVNVLDIHSDAIIAVAFDRAYVDSKWDGARQSARRLVKSLLAQEVLALKQSIKTIYRGAGSQHCYPKLRKHYWEKSFSCILTEDDSAIALFTELISQLAHLSSVDKTAFDRYWATRKHKTPSSDDRCAVESVNEHLAFIGSGMFSMVTKYTSRHISVNFSHINITAEVVPSLAFMVLSPANDISQSAQYLISAAFDVDGRQDCFRVLLTHFFHPTVKGIIRFLRTFNKYVESVPDACAMATSLVRCFTDIIEGLCSNVDGLLRSLDFFKKDEGETAATDLSSLWCTMVSANCKIFSEARRWATFYDNDYMIKWMRDALIFGRDLLAQRGIMEAAIVSAGETSKRHKRVEVRKMMVDELRPFLPELAKWLRLTDEELLYQSFSLIESILEVFRDLSLRPQDGLEKLWKVVTDGKKSGRTAPRLDNERLSKLEASLESFEEVASALPQKKVAPAAEPKVIAPSISKQPVGLTGSTTFPKHTINKSAKSILPQPSSQITLSRKPVRLAAAQPSHTHERPYDDSDGGGMTVPSFRKGSSAASSSSISVSRRKVSEPKNEGSVTPHEAESSSSEESDSEDEGQPQGLTALSKLQRTPKIKRPTERRQIKLMDAPRLSKQHFQPAYDRDYSRRVQGRMRPNISKLHRVLLSWNYDDPAPQPPHPEGIPTPIPVPDHFSDYTHYLRVFEPLFFLECWAQLIRSKEETSETYQCTIRSRGYIDDWIDITALIPGGTSNSWRVMDTDVVLLKGPIDKRSVLAKVQSMKAELIGVVLVLRCFFATPQDDPGLAINTTWQISKVFSLSTMAREYAALVSVPCFDLCDMILRPTLPELKIPSDKEVERTMESFRINKPQATAILSAVATPGISLIQGPPGTGKTATICGLVKLYLSRQPHSIAMPTDSQVRVTQKILLCAPSNAAIDEVARRIKEAFTGTDYKVVRIGADSAISNATKDISLDSLVDEALGSNQGAAKDAKDHVNALLKNLESIKTQRQQKHEEMSKVRDNAARLMALEEEIQQLSRQRGRISKELDDARDKWRAKVRDSDTERRTARERIITEAHVICATLSGTGHESLQTCDVGMVIIDEAAQAIELSSLIPFRFGFQRCVLVGDSKQLPPTVISQDATRLKYNQSLFVRFQNQNPERVHLLSIQYRMHPEISRLPSSIFYGGRLEDGPSMAKKTEKPWHSNPKFGVYRFFDVKAGVEEQVGQSQRNRSESQVAVSLYHCLRRDYPSPDFTVGVVTMYKAQVFELRQQFEQRFGRAISKEVDFNTVDGFQGQEKDVIILSCVRAGPGLQRVGFVADIRRMNVALTRAKSSVFILGNASTLERSDETWRSIVQNARARTLLTEVDASYFKPGVMPRANALAIPTSNRIPNLDSHLLEDPTIVTDPQRIEVPGPPEPTTTPAAPLKTGRDHPSPSVDPTALRVAKRPAEAALTSDAPPALPTGVAKPVPKPRIPPAKRQKSGAGMFISPAFRKSNDALKSVNKPKGP